MKLFVFLEVFLSGINALFEWLEKTLVFKIDEGFVMTTFFSDDCSPKSKLCSSYYLDHEPAKTTLKFNLTLKYLSGDFCTYRGFRPFSSKAGEQKSDE